MIVRFLAEECRKRGARLTIRLFVNNVLPDDRMRKAGKAENHWTALVQAVVAREFVPQRSALRDVSLRDRTDADRRIVLGICKEFATHQERIQAWKVRTNQTTTRFIDHYAELRVSGQL